MYQELTSKLINGIATCVNETELRDLWLRELQNTLGIRFHMEREHNDAHHNGVIIEFKIAGLFRGNPQGAAFNGAIQQLDRYIQQRSIGEGLDPSDYIGIATDGKHIAFAFMQYDKTAKCHFITPRHLMPVCESSILLLIQALNDATRRAVIAQNLIDDFGHRSPAGTIMMQALSDALVSQLALEGPNKIKMLFEEWQHLYGQVANLSNNQVDDILRSIGFSFSSRANERSISVALFVIHTYNSLVIKFLGAEIVSSLGDHTTFKYFAETTSALDDSSLIKQISNDIERGGLFSGAGINGFVEEAIFSWYLDAAKSTTHGSAICRGLRQILVGLAMYRTDNLTVARSRDVLKHFYQDLVPETLRKSLGEFYTPDWLVEVHRLDLKN